MNKHTDSTLDRFAPSLSASFNTTTKLPQGWEFFGCFETEAERDAMLARFPKSAKVYATTLSSERVYPAISARGNLTSDGVNKGINERGLKRYQQIVKAAPELAWKAAYTNSYESREAFEAAVR